jgi:hypothetical protein
VSDSSGSPPRDMTRSADRPHPLPAQRGNAKPVRGTAAFGRDPPTLDRGIKCRHLGVLPVAASADSAHDARALDVIDINFGIKAHTVSVRLTGTEGLIYALCGHGQLVSSTDVGNPAATNMISQIITNPPNIAS